MDALQKSNRGVLDKLYKHENDLLLYGTYSLKSTNEILSTLKGLYTRQSALENHMTNLSKDWWPGLYLSSWQAILHYGTELQYYLHTISEKYTFLYTELIEHVRDLTKGIATLSEGKMPPELFPISLLTNITTRVQHELTTAGLPYEVALKNPTSFYDLKLVTFGIDQKHTLVITFPVLLKSTKAKPLTLLEIETAPVPIDDLDTSADSFSEVQINKPYIATSDTHYIQLRLQELNMCKKIQHDFYCEETFMVKHTHFDTCESALFYNRSIEVIHNNCKFKYFHNSTVAPSVLDGGDQLLLANFSFQHGIDRHPRMMINKPQSSYTLVPWNILCNCTLSSHLAYLSPNIGACSLTPNNLIFKYVPNAAFLSEFHDLLKTHSKPSLNFTQLFEHGNSTNPTPPCRLFSVEYHMLRTLFLCGPFTNLLKVTSLLLNPRGQAGMKRRALF